MKEVIFLLSHAYWETNSNSPNGSSNYICVDPRRRKIARKIVLGLKKFDHFSQGLTSLRWFSIEDKLLLNTAAMVHKCLHHRVPNDLKEKFPYRSQVHNRQLRSVNNDDLNLPCCRLSTGLWSFAFRGAKVWNSLPLDLKLIPSQRIFKKNMHELLLINFSGNVVFSF